MWSTIFFLLVVVSVVHGIRAEEDGAARPHVGHDWFHQLMHDSPYTQESSDHTGQSNHPHHILLNMGIIEVDDRLRQAHALHQHRGTNDQTQSLNGQRQSDIHRIALNNGKEIDLHLPSPYTHPRRREHTESASPDYHEPTATDGSDYLDPSMQWLVHLKPPITQRTLYDLNALIYPYLIGSYLPHNTFLVVAPESTMVKLRQTENALDGRLLLVALLPVEARVEEGLEEMVRWIARERHSPLSSPNTIELRMHLAFPRVVDGTSVRSCIPTDRTDLRCVIEWLAKLRGAFPLPLDGAILQPIDSSHAMVRIVLTDSDDNNDNPLLRPTLYPPSLLSALSWIAAERGGLFSTNNANVRYAVQGDSSSSDEIQKLSVWNIGAASAASTASSSAPSPFTIPYPSISSVSGLSTLLGENQIVTIGDSGIDFDSCFFHDASGLDVPVNTVNMAHRKIISYITSLLPGSITQRMSPGDVDGHGTFTAGSVAGWPMSPSDQPNYIPSSAVLSELQRHSGLAPQAKLVVFDFAASKTVTSTSTGTVGTPGLSVPLNLYGEYLQKSYDLGSRISSNSWGQGSVSTMGFGDGNVKLSGAYESYASSIAQFIFDHPDFSFTMAVGNSGQAGYANVAVPSTAKNILTVGSSKNLAQSEFALGLGNAGVKGPTGLSAYMGTLLDSQSVFSVAPGQAGFGSDFYSSTLHQNIPVCFSIPSDGCTAITNNRDQCSGSVMIVDRGLCSFTTKALQVFAYGALMMIVVNTPDSTGSTDPGVNYQTIEMLPDSIGSGSTSSQINIPLVMISYAAGQGLKSYVRAWSLNPASLPPLTLSWPYSCAVSNDPAGNVGQDALSSFSSHGPTADGRIKPDILAPGEWIVSVKSTRTLGDYQCGRPSSSSVPDTGATTGNPFPATTLISSRGTSMSTPFISAGVALVRQYFTDGWYRDPVSGSMKVISQPTSALLKAMIIASGRSVWGKVSMLDQSTAPLQTSPVKSIFSVPKLSAPSFLQGFGGMDLSSVLSHPGGLLEDGELFVENAGLATQGSIEHYCFTIPLTNVGKKSFRATLVWTDPPALNFAGMALVNNLDLIVLAPAATGTGKKRAFIGNSPGSASTNSGSTSNQPQWDMLNNVEQVTIPTGQTIAGTYSVLVRGTNVPSAIGQSYALVVTGSFVIPTGGLGSCAKELFCPGDCSGNGICSTLATQGSIPIDSSRPGETSFTSTTAPSSTNPNTGFCACSGTWVGADCSVSAIPIDSVTTVPLTVLSRQWTYLSYQFNPLWDLQISVMVRVLLSGTSSADGSSLISTSDPDLYVLFPSTKRSVATGLNYPTLTYYTYSDVSTIPWLLVPGQAALHRLTIPSADLKSSTAGTIMIGLFGYGVGISHVEVSMDVVRSDSAPKPVMSSTGVANQLSSTGAVSGGTSSTGSGNTAAASSTGTSLPPSSTAPSITVQTRFNVSYLTSTTTMRLLLSPSTILASKSFISEFSQKFQVQLQTGLGLSSFTYSQDDTTSYRKNRVLVLSVVDGASNSTGGSKASSGGQSHSFRALSDPPSQSISTTDSVLVSFALLPSLRDAPTSAGSVLPSELSSFSTGSGTNTLDFLSSAELLQRLDTLLHANSDSSNTLAPSASFLAAGEIMQSLDLTYDPIESVQVMSYCSASSSSQPQMSAWFVGPCTSSSFYNPGSSSTGAAAPIIIGPDDKSQGSSTSSVFHGTNLILLCSVGGGGLILLLVLVGVCLYRRHHSGGKADGAANSDKHAPRSSPSTLASPSPDHIVAVHADAPIQLLDSMDGVGKEQLPQPIREGERGAGWQGNASIEGIVVSVGELLDQPLVFPPNTATSRTTATTTPTPQMSPDGTPRIPHKTPEGTPRLSHRTPDGTPRCDRPNRSKSRERAITPRRISGDVTPPGSARKRSRSRNHDRDRFDHDESSNLQVRLHLPNQDYEADLISPPSAPYSSSLAVPSPVRSISAPSPPADNRSVRRPSADLLVGSASAVRRPSADLLAVASAGASRRRPSLPQEEFLVHHQQQMHQPGYTEPEEVPQSYEFPEGEEDDDLGQTNNSLTPSVVGAVIDQLAPKQVHLSPPVFKRLAVTPEEQLANEKKLIRQMRREALAQMSGGSSPVILRNPNRREGRRHKPHEEQRAALAAAGLVKPK